jgi:hypothetical protein
MKITELLESFPHKVDTKQDQLPYDLAEDLMFFMRNDENFYRKHYYPHIAKIKEQVKQGRKLSSNVFMPMVQHAFECYTDKFPIRGLPESLEDDLCEEICSKLRTEEVQHINNDIY